MSETTEITEVLFRKDREDIVFAILPYDIADFKGGVTTYERLGQHSAGDYDHCIKTSKPATEVEYTPLKTEMESIGYNFKIVKQRNYNRYITAYNNLKSK